MRRLTHSLRVFRAPRTQRLQANLTIRALRQPRLNRADVPVRQRHQINLVPRLARDRVQEPLQLHRIIRAFAHNQPIEPIDADADASRSRRARRRRRRVPNVPQRPRQPVPRRRPRRRERVHERARAAREGV